MYWLPYALGVALVLVIAQRWWVGADWWWGIGVGAALIVVVGSGIAAWFKRTCELSAAGWLDESAHTQSRYRSALELVTNTRADPAFASIAVQQAEHSAEGIKLPTDHSKLWHEQNSVFINTALIALIVVAGIYMPMRSSPNPIAAPPSPVAIADAREQIQEQQQDLEELTGDLETDDELVNDALKDLEALEQELTASQTPSDLDSTSTRAASRVEQLADELDQRAQDQQLEEQALREELDKLKSESLSEESDLDRFREQLAEGNYEEAIDASLSVILKQIRQA